MMTDTLILALLLSCVAAGCSFQPHPYPSSFAPRESIIEKNYHAGDMLHQQLSDIRVQKEPMIVTSFSNLDDLNQTSRLGRLIPQQISSRLSQFGYAPVEIRLQAHEIVIREKNGEFALSRDTEKLNLNEKGHSILVGTFSTYREQLYVHVRIVRTSDHTVLAAYDYNLPSEDTPGVEPSVQTQ